MRIDLLMPYRLAHVASTLIGELVSSPAGVNVTASPSTANGSAVSDVFVCTIARTAAVSRFIVMLGGGVGILGGVGCMDMP
jgi:hypothetical protein